MTALRVIAGLVAGFVLGLILAANPSPVSSTAIGAFASVGTVFVSLIKMTVMPLLVSLLVASVGGMVSPGGLGRTGTKALVCSVVLLLLASIGSVMLPNPSWRACPSIRRRRWRFAVERHARPVPRHLAERRRWGSGSST